MALSRMPSRLLTASSSLRAAASSVTCNAKDVAREAHTPRTADDADIELYDIEGLNQWQDPQCTDRRTK